MVDLELDDVVPDRAASSPEDRSFLADADAIPMMNAAVRTYRRNYENY
jgi:hypothetical protein